MSTAPPLVPVLDTSQLDDLETSLGGAGLAEIYRLYLSEGPQDIRRLREAIAAGDASATAAAAHRLKGSSSSLGISRVKEAAAALEALAKLAAFDLIDGAMGRLVQEYEAADAAVRTRWPVS